MAAHNDDTGTIFLAIVLTIVFCAGVWLGQRDEISKQDVTLDVSGYENDRT